LGPHCPDYVATREKLLQDLLARGEITFESAHVRKDGSVVPVEIRARIMDLGDRRLILSVARDITDRKQAEAEVKLNEPGWQASCEFPNIPRRRAKNCWTMP